MTNDLMMQTVAGKRVPKTPVWIMRQAGRYLPEFREVRKQHSFFTVCQTPELACEVTLQPIQRYQSLFDASIIFSDILVVPQALGMEVQMLPEKGPHFPEPLVTPNDLERLKTDVDVELTLKYVYDAITLTKSKLAGQATLLGFSGAPWTLMAYMVEGGGSKSFSKAKRWLFAYPEASHKLLQIITDTCVQYLIHQAKAGAQMLQVFDSWAGELSPAAFREFSLPYLKEIVDRVKAGLGDDAVPMIVFAKGAHYAIDLLLDTGYDVISLDYTMDVRRVKREIREYLNRPECHRVRVTLQGNMDPSFLYADHPSIEQECGRILRQFLINEETGELEDESIGYICNLGHGILPDIPTENVRKFLETVKTISQQILAKAQNQ